MAWLEGWGYRKALTITGGSGAVTDYAIPLVVHYGSGTDSAGHVYLNGHAKADFSDVRFTAADQETPLDHWQETRVDSDQALYWIELPSLGASPATVAPCIYYGNEAASSASSGPDTFPWFSHFDADEDARFSGNLEATSYADGVLTFSHATATWKAIVSLATFPVGSCIRASVKHDVTSTQFGFGTADGQHRVAEYPSDAIQRIQKAIGGTYTNSSNATRSYDYNDTFNIHELRWTSAALKLLVNGVSIVDWTTTAPSANMPILIQTYARTIYFDWLVVRKYIETEPAQTSADVEESAGPPEPAIACAFSASPRTGGTPLEVQFSDQSTVEGEASITDYLWDFGDGATSTAQNPLHTFTDGRAYTISLTIWDDVNELTDHLTKVAFVVADDGVSHIVTAIESGTVAGHVETTGVIVDGGDLDPVIAALPPGWQPREYGGFKEICRVESGTIAGHLETTGTVLASAFIGRIETGEVVGNYDALPAVHATIVGKNIIRGQGFISLDRDMIAQSAAGRFMQRFDSIVLIGETYSLTQYKPWQAHVDEIRLVGESYHLTVIQGYPSTPPRFASQVIYPAGILIEWEPPEDEGSGTIQRYIIYRGLEAGSMIKVAELGGAARHYFDDGAPAGSIYKVLANNGVLDSDPIFTSAIIDPDAEHISLRDALTGEAWTGLPYAGWMGVRAIRLTPPVTFVLKQGSSSPIAATVYPADATVPALAWSSSRPDIASVGQTGLITALSPGRAVITAASTDGTHRSASVPVTVVPSFMVDDVRDHLLAAGFARVFARGLPDVDECIALLQLSGEAPDRAMEIDRPLLQVMIRSRDLRTAEALRADVHDALHMAAPLSINGTRYYAIEAMSTGQYSDKDRKGPRYVSTVSFRVERQRTIGETSSPARSQEISARRSGREHADIVADLVRQELDLYGFDNVPIFTGMQPDLRQEMAVSVEQRAGSPSDRARGYEFPRFAIKARALEPRVAEFLVQLLHYRLHRRDYILDAESGKRLWTVLAQGSPQQARVLSRSPRHEWEFELWSMMDR